MFEETGIMDKMAQGLIAARLHFVWLWDEEQGLREEKQQHLLAPEEPPVY